MCKALPAGPSCEGMLPGQGARFGAQLGTSATRLRYPSDQRQVERSLPPLIDATQVLDWQSAPVRHGSPG